MVHMYSVMFATICLYRDAQFSFCAYVLNLFCFSQEYFVGGEGGGVVMRPTAREQASENE